MIKSETNSTKKLEQATQKYQEITGKIVNNEDLQDPKLIRKFISDMDILIKKAKEKLAE